MLPYGVAFKLVAISGLVSLPFTCWAFGRLARFRYPMPELFAFAGLCFALNESTTIYGGNVLATMAGEFSFSIAISLMMLGLGLLARGLEDGKGRLMMWAAIVLALACLSHGIVLIYTAVGALVIVACRSGADLWRLLVSRISRRDGGSREQGLVYTVLATPALVGLVVLLTQAFELPVGVVALAFLPGDRCRSSCCASPPGGAGCRTSCSSSGCCTAPRSAGSPCSSSAFWVGPFLFNHDYMTDMKYGFKPDGGSESFWSMLFDQEPFLDVLINTLAIIGLIAVDRPPPRLRRRPRPHRADRRGDGVPHPRQPARDRAAVEPADPAVGVPDALPDDDGRRRRGRPACWSTGSATARPARSPASARGR